jgi:hypothetical protein
LMVAGLAPSWMRASVYAVISAFLIDDASCFPQIEKEKLNL